MRKLLYIKTLKADHFEMPQVYILLLLFIPLIYFEINEAYASVHYVATTSQKSLVIMSDGLDEPDTILQATCRGAKAVELRLGADFNVGKGEREPVYLVLRSKGKNVRITGRSFPSANVNMSGGTELVSNVSTNDNVFMVLLSEDMIRIRGSIHGSRTIKLEHKVTTALGDFLKCSAR